MQCWNVGMIELESFESFAGLRRRPRRFYLSADYLHEGRTLMFRLSSSMKAVAVWCMLAIVPAAARAQSEAKADVTGKWLFNVTTDAGTGTPTVTFKQQGDSLTGHYSSQTLGEADLKGTVKDGKINFAFRVEVQGNSL